MGALTEIANKRSKVNTDNASNGRQSNSYQAPITQVEQAAAATTRLMSEASRIFDEGLAEKYPSLAKDFGSNDSKKAKVAGQTALACIRTEAYMNSAKERYGEATVTSAFGSLNRKLIDVVKIFYPNQVINSIADVQMLDRQNGEIFVIRPKFSNTAAGVTKGQEVFANQTDGTYASEELVELLGTGNGSLTNFTDTLIELPVRPNTIRILREGTEVARDDGKGVISGSGVSGTINYTTGAVSVTWTAAVTTAHVLQTQYDADTEVDTALIRKLEFGLELIQVKAKQHPLMVDWSVQAEMAAAAHLDLDVPDTLTNMAAAFVRTERDTTVIKKIAKAAAVDSTLNFNASMTSVEYTAQQKYGEIELKVNAAEAIIYSKLNRSGVSYVLCGANAAQVFMNCPTFQAAADASPIGPSRIGTIRNGTVDIIRANAMATNEYVVGFKGMMAGDSSVIFAEWVPIYFTPVWEAPQLVNSRGVASFYDLFINNKDYFVKGTISNFAA